MSRQRILIIGGGFGGVTLAQELRRLKSLDAEITLISSENYMLFTPLLAETVGRSISPLHVAVVGRQMTPGVAWLTARVTGLNLACKAVDFVSADGHAGSVSYDQLVLACGSTVNLSEIPGLRQNAYALKTLGDAISLGNDVIGRLESASLQTDAKARSRLLTVIVIGGGFSGVEVSGEIAGLLQSAAGYYPQLKRERTRVILIHRGDRVLPELDSPGLSEFAAQRLRKAGVELMLGSDVAEVTPEGVWLKSGEQMVAGTVVCTVGTAPNPLIQDLGLPMHRGRLQTASDMRVEGAADLWAVGDCALVPNARDGRPSPPTAQFAVRQAKQLARNLLLALAGQATNAFSYRPAGMLASLGRHRAVARVFGMEISGLPAWILWRGIYLFKMPTFVRRLYIAVDWAWDALFAPNLVHLQIRRTTSRPDREAPDLR